MPSSNNFFTILFADDTTFQIGGTDIGELYHKINEELLRASIWFQANKLTLNINKTKYMVFKPKNVNIDHTVHSIKIGNETIERIGEECNEKPSNL